MPDKIEVPTAVTGVVTPLHDISYCMDGASHLIHTQIGNFRLKGRNDDVTKKLVAIADGNSIASVMGFIVHGTECTYISVYYVAATTEVVKVFNAPLRDPGVVPWPLMT